MREKEVLIDLNDVENNSIIFDKIQIERVLKKILFISPKNPEYVCHRISISFSEIVGITAKSDLFKIQIDHENQDPSSEKDDISCPDGNINMAILLDKTCIEDVSGLSPEAIFSTKTTVKILFQPTESEVPEVIEISLNIKILKQNAGFTSSFRINSQFEKGVIYEKKIFPLGEVLFENNSKYKFAYPLRTKDISFILIDDKGTTYRNVVNFEKDEYAERLEEDSQAKEIDHIASNEISRAYIEIDLAKLSQPKEDTYYTIAVSGSKCLDNNNFILIDEQSETKNARVFIQCNQQKTELYVCLWDSEGKAIDITNADKKMISASLRENYLYSLSNVGSTTTVVSGFVSNRATVPEMDPKCLIISKLGYTSYASYISTNKTVESFHEIIEIEFRDRNGIILSTGTNGKDVELPNELNSQVTFFVKFRDSNFKKLKNVKAENKMFARVSIDYEFNIVDPNGNPIYPRKQKKSHEFYFKIKQDEGNEWLAVDFGTSAIVAQFGHPAIEFEADGQINLQHELRKLVTSTVYDNGDYEEKTTNFLSSSVILRDTDDFKIKNKYQNNFIHLSPSVQELMTDSHRISPYIKSLVGFKYIPSKLLGAELTNYSEVEVNKIIQAIYYALLNEFILPVIRIHHQNDLNKIALSIPNYFTSTHKKLLRDLIKDIFPSIWGDYVVFIKESNAVAWHYFSNIRYYVQNYSLPLESPSMADKLVKDRVDNGDVVIAYDMGAGTLDITLFKFYKNDNETWTIQILGYYGSTTAGNYLDYLLAEEVYDRYKYPLEVKDLEHPTKHYKNMSSIVFPYRSYIRNEIKPALSGDVDLLRRDMQVTSLNSINGKEINLDEIVSSPRYKDYLTKVCDDALSILKTNSIGDYGEVKTLIMSGRGVQLYGLKEQLQESISSVFNSSPLIIYPDQKSMKDMVVKGSLYYSRHERGKGNNRFIDLDISARYGYLLHHKIEGWKYTPLITPSSKITMSNQFHSRPIKGAYVEDKLMLKSATDVLIIHTFLSDQKQIENDINRKSNHFYESSSILFSFDIGTGMFNEEELLKLLVGVDGEVYVRLGHVMPDAHPSSPIDIEHSNGFRKSMWPFSRAKDL